MMGEKLESNWREESWLIEYVATHLTKGHVGLVLGAGASLQNLPSWQKLLNQLYDSKATDGSPPFSDYRSGKSAAVVAQDIKKRYYQDDVGAFLNAVREALYRGVNMDFKSLYREEKIAAMGALIMNSSRGRIANIISFNFDSVLETYLSYYGYTVSCIQSPRYYAENVDVTIYHPHGFLPHDLREKGTPSIILAQEEFEKEIGASDSPWRQQLVTILRTHFCLFIGLSGEDEHLRLLLTAAGSNHASRMTDSAYWGLRLARPKDGGHHPIWEESRIYTHEVKNYDEALADFLFRICQRAVQLIRGL
ncbi:SIR2 family protein [Desulfosarcina sp. OttesenSCG-928-A07]|nr:SIR2 family protein [Desulfosarcina sp. OttesenSCG-928-A07]